MLSTGVMTTKVQLGGRLSREIVDRVRKEAAATRRTLGTELEILLEEALAARDAKHKPEKAAKR